MKYNYTSFEWSRLSPRQKRGEPIPKKCRYTYLDFLRISPLVQSVFICSGAFIHVHFRLPDGNKKVYFDGKSPHELKLQILKFIKESTDEIERLFSIKVNDDLFLMASKGNKIQVVTDSDYLGWNGKELQETKPFLLKHRAKVIEL